MLYHHPGRIIAHPLRVELQGSVNSSSKFGIVWTHLSLQKDNLFKRCDPGSICCQGAGEGILHSLRQFREEPALRNSSDSLFWSNLHGSWLLRLLYYAPIWSLVLWRSVSAVIFLHLLERIREPHDPTCDLYQTQVRVVSWWQINFYGWGGGR
jgi:hypothetical protein